MQRAFTLLELAIVLAIIALLIGGIMVGQSVVRNAQINSIASELQRYDAAFVSFSEKYNGLPGDLTTATSHWGIAGGATGSEAVCFTTQGTGTQTCNGNGDNKIHTAAGSSHYERWRAWQQLGLAGYIDGSYTGVSGVTGSPGVNNSDVGLNTPATSVPDVGISLAYLDASGGSVHYFPQHIPYHVLFAGKEYDSGAGFTYAAAFTPKEVWGMDSKIDDGAPGYGIVRTFRPTTTVAPNCSDNEDPEIAQYRVNDPKRQCAIMYLGKF